MMLFSVVVMVATLAMVQGCSESESPVESVVSEVVNHDTDTDTNTNIGLDNGFIEDLENGEYMFAVDDNGNLIPLDGNLIPEVEQTLYDQFLIDANNSKYTKESLAASTTTSYWRYAIYREICYALSRTRYFAGSWGTSTRIYYRSGGWYAGDWNYCGFGVGSGGSSCKEFARIIVSRATGGRYSLPSEYNYASGSISWCNPGDVIQRSNSWGTPHTAIVFKILRRDSYGRATMIDVIDNNFIASRLISRHVLPMWGYELYQFKVW